MAIFENKGQYILMKPSNVYSLKVYRKALHDVRALCDHYNLTKILADIRGRNEYIPAADRFLLGVEAADVLGSEIQLAILAPAAMIDKLGENAALNRGGNVFITDNRAKALRWLGVK